MLSGRNRRRAGSGEFLRHRAHLVDCGGLVRAGGVQQRVELGTDEGGADADSVIECLVGRGRSLLGVALVERRGGPADAVPDAGAVELGLLSTRMRGTISTPRPRCPASPAAYVP